MTNETRKWLKATAQQLYLHCRQHNIQPITGYTFFDLWWFVPNTKCDTHNSEKALFDVFQKGGLVSNDKFVMNRTQGVNVDSVDPHVVVEFDIP